MEPCVEISMKRIVISTVALLLLCSAGQAWGQLPTFTRVNSGNAMFSTPAWMVTDGDELYFPRFLDLTEATIAADEALTLPEADYCIMYASDHGDMNWGRILITGSIETPANWSDAGSAINSAGGESPQAVYDPANHRINVYSHKDSSSVTYATQAELVSHTTDLTTFTPSVELGINGAHTGYGWVGIRDGTWWMYHLMTGGTGISHGFSQSADGDTWGTTQWFSATQHHILGQDKVLEHASMYESGGQWYAIGNLIAQPRASNVASAIVAIPVSDDWQHYTGGYQTLITPGGEGAADEILYSFPHMFDIGETTYLLYVGTDGDGTNSIMLAKENGGTSATTNPIHAINANGTIVRDNVRTLSLDWDAANDAMPAWLEMVVENGTDASSQSAGNYYEIKTGSGSLQEIALSTVSAYDLTAYETVDVHIRGFTATLEDKSKVGWRYYWGDTTEGTVLLFWGGNLLAKDGRLGVYDGGVKNYEGGTYVFPWTGDAKDWACYNARDVIIRSHDHGASYMVFIDGCPAFYRDISGEVTWSATKKFRLRVNNWTAYPVAWVRFTGISVYGYEGAGTYTLTAPATASGKTGVASGNFTIALAANQYPGSIIVTPAAADVAGTFTPATVTLTDADRTKTVTFTPTAPNVGTATITTTDDGSMTDPAGVEYEVTAAGGGGGRIIGGGIL